MSYVIEKNPAGEDIISPHKLKNHQFYVFSRAKHAHMSYDFIRVSSSMTGYQGLFRTIVAMIGCRGMLMRENGDPRVYIEERPSPTWEKKPCLRTIYYNLD